VTLHDLLEPTPRSWRARWIRLRDRLPVRVRRALLSRKAAAIFLIALLGKLAFYGVLAWQLLVRR
jgi:hypothetical protein